MNCDAVDELLSDLIDGELAEGARSAVESHLATCGRCAASFAQLRRTVRFVRANADTRLAAGTPGGWYSDFTRSLVDPEFRRATADVIWEAGFHPQDEGRTR